MFSTITLYANGGPIAKGGFINGSNTIKLISEDKFTLEREDLFFHIQDDYVYVTAIYLIKNLDDKKTIKYGFAVDYRDNPRSGNYSWETDYITDFRIYSNDKELKYKNSDEKNVRIDSIHYNRYDVMTELDTISRKWFISELTFENLETKQLIVKYRVKTSFADWPMLTEYGGDYRSLPFSDRKFSYYLRPSGFWGNGNAGKFKLTISFDNSEKYKKIDIKGIKGFRKENGCYVFECNDYNLLNNDYVKIDYNYYEWEKANNLRKFSNSNLIKEYIVSNEHPKYPASNLFDNNKNTTYVPLNKGEGNNWIEIIFKENVVLFGVAIINGYAKNNETYFNNNIVTRLKLTVKSNYSIKPVTIVRDVKLNRKEARNDFSTYFIGLEDLLLGELFGNVDASDNISDQMSSMYSLRIEILETDKGVKYDDTCISELLLYGVIDKKR